MSKSNGVRVGGRELHGTASYTVDGIRTPAPSPIFCVLFSFVRRLFSKNRNEATTKS